MTAFIAYSDESEKKENQRFYYAGLVAPKLDWDNWFSPAWQERVLDGPPKLEYLHMTEDKWRTKNGISWYEAEKRIDEGVRVFDSMGSIFPVTVSINAQLFRQLSDGWKIETTTRRQKAKYKAEPDYLCFLLYVFCVLKEISSLHGNVEKVDFVIERKKKVTHRFDQDFYKVFPSVLKELGEPDLSGRCGEFSQRGKELIPLSAADFYCWHMQRVKAQSADQVTLKRFLCMSDRISADTDISDEQLKSVMTMDWTKYESPVYRCRSLL
jgi:hypothetical protein